MKMLKKAASVALASALVLSMAACGSSGGSDGGSSDADTFKTVSYTHLDVYKRQGKAAS